MKQYKVKCPIPSCTGKTMKWDENRWMYICNECDFEISAESVEHYLKPGTLRNNLYEFCKEELEISIKFHERKRKRDNKISKEEATEDLSYMNKFLNHYDVKIEIMEDYYNTVPITTEVHVEPKPYRWYHFVFFPLGIGKLLNDFCEILSLGLRHNFKPIKDIKDVFRIPSFIITLKPKSMYIKIPKIQELNDKNSLAMTTNETIRLNKFAFKITPNVFGLDKTMEQTVQEYRNGIVKYIKYGYVINYGKVIEKAMKILKKHKIEISEERILEAFNYENIEKSFVRY